MIIAVNSQIFEFVAGLVIPIRIPSREAKAGIEIHPVTVEAKIRTCSI